MRSSICDLWKIVSTSNAGSIHAGCTAEIGLNRAEWTLSIRVLECLEVDASRWGAYVCKICHATNYH